MEFGTASIQCGICSKPQPLLQKTYFSYASETLATCVGSCLHPHALALVLRPRVTLVNLFPKIDFFSLKGFVFYFNTPQVNLISNWALNWP